MFQDAHQHVCDLLPTKGKLHNTSMKLGASMGQWRQVELPYVQHCFIYCALLLPAYYCQGIQWVPGVLNIVNKEGKPIVLVFVHAVTHVLGLVCSYNRQGVSPFRMNKLITLWVKAYRHHAQCCGERFIDVLIVVLNGVFKASRT